MKVLVINGSPKANSNTMCLTRAFLDGIAGTGEHEFEVIDVIKQKISPCIGCFECWKRLDGRCIIDDYQNVILQKMRQADTVIWSFPLYCCGLPGHIKTVLDRTIPLVRMSAKDGDSAIKQGREEAVTKKRYIVICGSGFPLGAANFDAVKIQCIHMFGRVRVICVNETPLMAVPEAEQYTKPLLEKFKAAGEEFGKTTFIKGSTLKELQTPMLSNEDYIRIANKKA